MLQPRAFMFPNRARLSQVLILMRLAGLRVDTATDYASGVRAFLGAHDGHPPRTYGAAYDKTAKSGWRSPLWEPLDAQSSDFYDRSTREKSTRKRPGQGDRKCE